MIELAQFFLSLAADAQALRRYWWAAVIVAVTAAAAGYVFFRAAAWLLRRFHARWAAAQKGGAPE